jgi:hypothetical protein
MGLGTRGETSHSRLLQGAEPCGVGKTRCARMSPFFFRVDKRLVCNVFDCVSYVARFSAADLRLQSTLKKFQPGFQIKYVCTRLLEKEFMLVKDRGIALI